MHKLFVKIRYHRKQNLSSVFSAIIRLSSPAGALCIQIEKAFPFDRHSAIPYKLAEPEQERRLESRVTNSGPMAQAPPPIVASFKAVFGRKRLLRLRSLETGNEP